MLLNERGDQTSGKIQLPYNNLEPVAAALSETALYVLYSDTSV